MPYVVDVKLRFVYTFNSFEDETTNDPYFRDVVEYVTLSIPLRMKLTRDVRSLLH